ncbi:MAG TPA: hypothetical protein VIJ63_19465, partial [Roseiarcus sp.]
MVQSLRRVNIMAPDPLPPGAPSPGAKAAPWTKKHTQIFEKMESKPRCKATPKTWRTDALAEISYRLPLSASESDIVAEP